MPGSTSYFMSDATLNTCSRYAVRYGDVDQHSPGQYAKPPFGHWNLRSSFSALWTTGRTLPGSMPGSGNVPPRSAASSSANAREPRCSAHPYGYSSRYLAPSASPTIAVDDSSTWRPPKPG